MSKTDAIPQTIHSKGPEGEEYKGFTLRDELHNGRPAWDRGLHWSLCWTPYDDQDEYGFWSVANLWTRDDKGQATGIVFQTPERPHMDGPGFLPPTATRKGLPPLGNWGARPPVGRRPHVGGADGGAVRVVRRSAACALRTKKNKPPSTTRPWPPRWPRPAWGWRRTAA